MEAYNKELGTEILISDAVFDALGNEFVVEATDHGPILLKGRSAEQHSAHGGGKCGADRPDHWQPPWVPFLIV